MSSSSSRLLLATTFALLAAAPFASAQNTRTWTGTTDSSWTVPTNWNASFVPVSGDTALFNGAGNGHTSISLGASSQPIKIILFDTAGAAAYTLGTLSSGDKFNFDAGGAITVNSTVTTPQLINAATQINSGLTVTNSDPGGLTLAGNVNFGSTGTLTVNNAVANTTTTLGGNITDVAGQPGSLSLMATTAGASNINNFIINGTNTYTGTTTIQVNTGTGGNIQLGSDSPFGTGPVTLTLVITAPQFSALTGTRTIGNAFKMNSGMTFTGANSFAFTGPLTIINSAAGGSRTLTNSITAAGKTATLGASAGSSTITIGNPVANGGDGIGKTAIFSPSTGATTIINDILQDPAAGGGVASATVRYGGSAGGVSQINGVNTYTGPTMLDGSSTVKFSTDSPFGVGTLTGNNTVNNILEPIGGSRTIANAVTMGAGGLTIANDTGDTSSLTLAGPISMLTNGRFLNNNFAANGGTLTLGSAASPSTITLPTTTGQIFTISGTGTTVINDVIQNPSPAPSPAASVGYSTSGPVSLNAQNTYTGNTSLDGAGTIFRIGADSNGLPGPSFTAGPFGIGTITQNNSTVPTFKPIGADRSIANAININTTSFGFAVANGTAGEDPTGNHNLTLTGPITLLTTSRTITNNMASGASLTLGSISAPSTLSLGSTLFFQGQPSGGSTIINDAISGVGGLTVQNDASVTLNGSNNYSGVTTLTGSGSPKLFVNGSNTGTGGVTIGAVGTLGGTGSIAGTISNSGKIAPGNSVGTLTATGNVTMNGGSHLEIELNGASADKLVVGGNLNLSNVESLDVIGTGQGLSWVIATYTGTRTGTFENVTSGYSVSYGAATNGQITLNKAPSGVNGDYNNDGKVDADDYITWRKNNGTNNALVNDNGLGTPVGQAQYTLWRSNYGKPPGSGTGALGDGSTVPEPGTMLLLLLGFVGLSFWRRRFA
jgi:fibronectin-binding autotransporter adhesin